MKFPFFSGRKSGVKSSSDKALRRKAFLRRALSPERLEDRAMFAILAEFRLEAVPVTTPNTDGADIIHPGLPGSDATNYPTLQQSTGSVGTVTVDKGSVFELRLYAKNNDPLSNGVAFARLDLGLDSSKVIPVTNEVQSIEILATTAPTGGSFSLTFNGVTQVVNYSGVANTTRNNLNNALNSLLGNDNFVLTQLTANRKWNITFQGAFKGTDVNQLVMNTTALTGGTGVSGLVTSVNPKAAVTDEEIRANITPSPIMSPGLSPAGPRLYYTTSLGEVAFFEDNPAGLDFIRGIQANGLLDPLVGDYFPGIVEREFVTLAFSTLDGTDGVATQISLAGISNLDGSTVNLFIYQDGETTGGGELESSEVQFGGPFNLIIREYVSARADLIHAGRATAIVAQPGKFRLNVLADNGNGADTNSTVGFGLNITNDAITTSLGTSTAVRATDGQSITYTPPPGFSIAPAGQTTGIIQDTFTYKIVTTQAANANNFAYSDTATVTVNLVAPNLPPVNSGLPATLTINEGATLSLLGLSIADSDNTGPTNVTTTFTFTDANNVAVPGTLSIGGVPQGTNSTFSVTDTVANINAALAGGLQYTPTNLDFNGTLRVTMVTNDNGSGLGAAPATDTDVLNVAVTAVNDPPTITGLPTTTSITEEETLSLTTLAVADVDAGTAQLDLTITANRIANSTNYGQFTFTANGAEEITNAAGNLVLRGTLANLNAALATLVYAPDPDQLGSYLFTITANDGGNTGIPGSSVGVETFNLDVIASTRPVAVDDVYDGSVPGYPAATEDQIFTITNVLENDRGSGVDTLSIVPNSITNVVITEAAVLGGATLNVANAIFISGTGEITIDLALPALQDFFGTIEFDYELTDSGGIDPGADVFARVTVVVNNVNDAPVSNNGTLSLSGTEDTNISFNLTSFFTDADNDAMTAVLVTESTPGGTLVTNALGNVTYTPPANFNGLQTLTFRANDGVVNSAGTMTVEINFAPVNDAPTAGNKTVFVFEGDIDSELTINDIVSDVDNSNSEIDIVSLDANVDGVTFGGFTTVDQPFTFTPPPDFNGTLLITYVVADPDGEEATGVITVQVAAQNDAPVAVDDGPIDVGEGTTTNIPVLANDFDVDADPAHVGIPGTVQPGSVVSIVTGPSVGTATVVNNQIRYVAPTLIATQQQITITYKVTDPSNAESNEATVTINLQPTNDPPAASNFSVTAVEDTDLVFNVFTLGNVSDPDSPQSAWTVEIVNGPSNGSLIMGTNGEVTYRPNANYNGSDSFTYRINDNSTIAPINQRSPVRTVSITVTEVNDPPVARNDSQPANIGLIINNANNSFINEIDVLANDGFGVDAAAVDAPLRIMSFGTAANPTNGQTEQGGTLTLVNGKIRYKAPAGQTADFTDSFTYTIADRNGNGLTATAVATFTVQQAVPVDIKVSVYQDTPLRPRAAWGDGIRQPGEKGYQNVRIIVVGRDVNGQAVRKVGATNFNGNVTFKDMLPGKYQVKQVQPAMVLDGRESSPDLRAGSILVRNRTALNDRFDLDIPTVPASPSGQVIDLFFSEMGVAPRFINLQETLASSTPNGLIIASSKTGVSLWNQALGGFANLKNVTATVAANKRSVRVVFLATDNTRIIRNYELNGSRVRLMGTDNNGNTLIRMDGTARSFGLTKFIPGSAATASFATLADEFFGGE